MNMKKTISVGSDFSGVGAFETALKRVTERKGMNVRSVFACDMDKHARTSYLANHDAPETFFENVYDRSIPEDSLDIYMTSPPCQSFSIAGLKKGKDDPRGILFFNSFEFIKTNNPRFAIFENVKGLVSDDEGRTFQEWVTLLGGKSINGAPVIFPYEDALPYHLYFSVLNAKDFDVPQTRERVFLVLIRDDEDNSFQFPKGRPFTRVLRDVLEDEVDEKYFLSEKHIQRCLKHPANEKLLEREIPEFCRTILSGYHKGGFSNQYLKINSATQKGYEEGRDGDSIDLSMPESKTRRGRIGKGYAHALRTNGQQGVIQLNPSNESNGRQPYQQNRIYDVDGISPALNNSLSTGGNLINDFRIRRLTPRECFRLMDFDDDFKFVVSETQLYRQAGNSIVCRVLEDIIDKLKL